MAGKMIRKKMGYGQTETDRSPRSDRSLSQISDREEETAKFGKENKLKRDRKKYGEEEEFGREPRRGRDRSKYGEEDDEAFPVGRSGKSDRKKSVRIADEELGPVRGSSKRGDKPLKPAINFKSRDNSEEKGRSLGRSDKMRTGKSRSIGRSAEISDVSPRR